MKVGDKIRMFNIRDGKTIDNTIYEIVDIMEASVKLRHPKIGGHFTFTKKNIAE